MKAETRSAKDECREERVVAWRGHIENGVVVLDEPLDIADGTAVTVEPVESVPRPMVVKSPHTR